MSPGRKTSIFESTSVHIEVTYHILWKQGVRFCIFKHDKFCSNKNKVLEMVQNNT